MANLEIVVDESGEATDPDTSFYLLTLVFHEQGQDINQNFLRYKQRLGRMGLPNIPFHASPLRNAKGPYATLTENKRKALLVAFGFTTEKLPITYHTFACTKAGSMTSEQIERTLWRQVSVFFVDHIAYFQSFEQVKVYYDGGQKIVRRILENALSIVVSDVGLSWEHPIYGEYRLLQVADYLCDLERAELRYASGDRISGTTNAFYGSHTYFRSHFYKQAKRKRLE